MLPTRSLPPQFLLPSWTAAEVALAVQRSYSSSVAAPSFEIHKHSYGEREIFLKQQSPFPGVRRFKPHTPRLIPTPLAGFYVGRKHNGPAGDIIFENEDARGRLLPELGDDQKGTILRRQRSGNRRQEGITGHGGIKAERSSAHHARSESPNTENTKLWITKPKVRKHREGLGSYILGSNKPTTAAQEAVQQLDVEEPSDLDYSGRWTDSANSAPKSRSFERLPWETDQPPPMPQQFRQRPGPNSISPISTKIRIPPAEPDCPRETMSLFQELFPEECKTRRAAIRLAEEKLDKLPAFKWDMDENFDQDWQTEREAKKAKKYTIPSREPANFLAQDPLRSMPYRAEAVSSPRNQPSVVVMEGLSKNLEESDFFRFGPKGNHIEGWTSGIQKVIPARDHTTLQPLGYYYILFSDDTAARAYMDNTHRLHMLGKLKGPSSMPFMPSPPGALREGESMKELLRGFSVVPRQNKLSMRLLNKPYRPGVLELITQGGPPALANRRANGEALVLFSVDVGTITYHDILYAIKDDGRQRNMHWKFAGGRAEDITSVTYEKRPSQDEKGVLFKVPEKYIFAMKDVQEARRFVREWHRRPIEVVKRGQREELGQERPATVSAELLW